MLSFYFILHPLQWEFESDAESVYGVEQVTSDEFLVSWFSPTGLKVVIYSLAEVQDALNCGAWIITDENGEY